MRLPGRLSRAAARAARAPSFPALPPPIRGEIFSSRRLERYAASLAREHRAAPGPARGKPILSRLLDNGRALLRCYRELSEAIRAERLVSPGAEWLVDNFHIVEEQLREVREDLPRRFYRELPKLREGELEGLPRVFGIAWAFVGHTDSRVDLDDLRRFVLSYQRHQALTIGELWAVAIMLRVVLVENLRRLSDGMVQRREAQERADRLAEALEKDGADLTRWERALDSRAFVVRLAERLHSGRPQVGAGREWLTENLARRGLSLDELVRADHQSQGLGYASVRNVITSMRLLSSVEWAEFFESVSLVDRQLRKAPGFSEMDFASRDRYRKAVEELSRGSRASEIDVAARAVRLARQAGRGAPGGPRERAPDAERRGDPGYYLISKGRGELEADVAFRPPPLRRLRRAVLARAAAGYAGTAVLLAVAIDALAVGASARMGLPARDLLLIGALALVPASELAIAALNRAVSKLTGPRLLPKLELAGGVPARLRTVVAIPAILGGDRDVLEVTEQLEAHFLSNPEGDIRFAILSDWADAAEPIRPEDERLLALARDRVEELHHRYGPVPGGARRFLLFHRRREWNPGENCWMGWERKRGKLSEFNGLLRGASDTTFLAPEGPASRVPEDVRFVVTLDADTRVPRDTVRRLVGALAHPLNRPVFDPSRRIVVEGYGILQPKITPAFPERGAATLFQKVFSAPCGTDPYAFVTSDVYQDLFGEGIYTGKGIYDVDAFAGALSGRVPENSLLSHDLFEGLFARAGFVSDVELFENFPSHYQAAASRAHRWVRGDWQLLPWLLPRIPAAGNATEPNPIPGVGRWKILDNLRRSLVAPTSFLTIVAACAMPGGQSLLWALAVGATILLPMLAPAIAAMIPRRRGIAKRSFVRGVGADFAVAISRSALTLVFLAHQAWLMADAIVRTLARTGVTRRHLLQWVSSADAGRRVEAGLAGTYRRMGGAVVLAAAAGIAVTALRGYVATELTFSALWLLSPAIALLTSTAPGEKAPAAAGPDEVLRMRDVARRTWRYFETFVTADDHDLPPDNFQDDPHPLLARRTSPTNVGLYLLSVVAAHDFGWIGLAETRERLARTFAGLGRLELYRGHLYNWYDTERLVPMEPRYVSTVDSGNLLAAFLTVRQACLEYASMPAPRASAAEGLSDHVRMVAEALSSAPPRDASERRLAATIRSALSEIASALRAGGGGDLSALLADLAGPVEAVAAAGDAIAALGSDPPRAELGWWGRALRAAHRSHLRDPAPAAAASPARRELEEGLLDIARGARAAADAMDLRFLYDDRRKLFAIGYLVSEGRLDAGYYDLLASEARIVSFLAVARGDVAPSHWFRLGRPLTPVEKGSALVSWSGSMFEYLMPDLLMTSPPGSLLDRTEHLIVRRQIRFGRQRRVPWGISESAYNDRGYELAYRYSSFGVSGLGLKRGLSEDVVVAPYATALAALVAPSDAARNFERLERMGAAGAYGFYDALDFTPRRLPEARRFALVRTVMAHHAGMTIVALDDALCGAAMRRRFRAEPAVRAAELLLHERTPRGVAVARPRAEEVHARLHAREQVPPALRRFRSPHSPTPRTHVLSNGRYSVMITAAGSGWSRWRGLAVTRWREDPTRDCWGSFLYLSDAAAGRTWSAGFHPTSAEPDSYEVTFHEDRAEIRRWDGPIATALEIIVSPEADAELRRLSLTNLGSEPREIAVTSYAEVVLAPAESDAAHPAFSSFFVETEFRPELEALVAHRRPRSRAETPAWAGHLASLEGEAAGPLEYETDRARFLGRGGEAAEPRSLRPRQPLSGIVGAVLDPVFALRRRVRLAPGATARLTFATVVAETREALLSVADRVRDPGAFERASTLAWTQAQVELRYLGISAEEAHHFQRLTTRLLYSDPTLRARPELLSANRRGPSALWGYGISGDRPIVLVRIDEAEERGIVRQLLQAQEYWSRKGIPVDLVVLNERPPSYTDDLQGSLEAMLRATSFARPAGHGGDQARVFLLQAAQMPPRDRELLEVAARAVFLPHHGTLAEQSARLLREEPAVPPPPRPRRPQAPPAAPAPAVSGRFEDGGREFVIEIPPGAATPLPWVNVVANESFGFEVSESGSGFTWSVNSRENQLTPWSNDAVGDPPGEVIYLRDEESGDLWSATALPIREESPYVARHGQGYSRFQHESHGIGLDLCQFAAAEDPVKISRLRVSNLSGKPRRLCVALYAEWSLGPPHNRLAPYVVTFLDGPTRALFARNPWNEEFASRVAFLDLGGAQTEWTGDRTEFLGRDGRLAAPAALARRSPLTRRLGAGLDPCGALLAPVALAPGQTVELVALLGQADGEDSARALVERYRRADPDEALARVRSFWDGTLGALEVRTPDPALDVMVNRWLLYQTLSCRLWARSGFFQSGGAFGFRDQLQDVGALVHVAPDLARRHVLRCAGRQFREGDVQHWWHPPSGRGIRTRIADDRVWLADATRRYLEATGDASILDERVAFLEGPALAHGEEEAYFLPRVAEEEATLYEHCARALDSSLAVGARGLPLIGTGDWNDGLNRVGAGGRGESVWLGWFLIANLRGFAGVAETRGERERAERWRRHADALASAVEREAWDGAWYRRAFFDDGTPLGTASAPECRIDSVAQSWAVLSGAGARARQERAMRAAADLLVRREEGLVLLLDPPFSGAASDPGYIAAYPPGVRENGGQYTHAAIWALLAFAELGEAERAMEILELVNPAARARTPEALERYGGEPYAVAADVSASPLRRGRCGWTWYTGSAGWLYRGAVEGILGLRLRGRLLSIRPVLPGGWSGYEATLRFRSARYEIAVRNGDGPAGAPIVIEVDGRRLPDGSGIELADDAKAHRIDVWAGGAVPATAREGFRGGPPGV